MKRILVAILVMFNFIIMLGCNNENIENAVVPVSGTDSIHFDVKVTNDTNDDYVIFVDKVKLEMDTELDINDFIVLSGNSYSRPLSYNEFENNEDIIEIYIYSSRYDEMSSLCGASDYDIISVKVEEILEKGIIELTWDGKEYKK